jgi:hypothetical protein
MNVKKKWIIILLFFYSLATFCNTLTISNDFCSEKFSSLNFSKNSALELPINVPLSNGEKLSISERSINHIKQHFNYSNKAFDKIEKAIIDIELSSDKESAEKKVFQILHDSFPARDIKTSSLSQEKLQQILIQLKTKGLPTSDLESAYTISNNIVVKKDATGLVTPIYESTENEKHKLLNYKDNKDAISEATRRGLENHEVRIENFKILKQNIKITNKEDIEEKYSFFVVICQDSQGCFDDRKPGIVFKKNEIVSIYPNCGPSVIEIPRLKSIQDCLEIAGHNKKCHETFKEFKRMRNCR